MEKHEFLAMLDRYLDGIASQEEVRMVANYLDSFQQDTDMPQGLDIARARVLLQLQQRFPRQRRIRPLWSAAAAVLLLVMAGAYFWPRPAIVPPQTAAVPRNIMPGGSRAVLTLGNGATVALDSTGHSMIGRGIRQQGGVLLYEGGAAAGYNTLTTPRGGQFRIALPDGTQVWLNAASSLQYPTAFTGSDRTVVVSGEAYFEVVKNAEKPFRVKISGGAEVEVLGTSFNIQAYADETDITATLLQGRIRMLRAQQSVVLRPGQQAHIPDRKATGPIAVVDVAGTDKVMAWKNGLFNFEGARLPEVMRQLSRWYDIEVVYENNIPDIEFVGEMSRDVPLADLLKSLRGFGLHFRIEEGRRLIITR